MPITERSSLSALRIQPSAITVLLSVVPDTLDGGNIRARVNTVSSNKLKSGTSAVNPILASKNDFIVPISVQ
ncbi:hypothetical protein D3C71_789810 [compost metagenome]